MLQANLTDDRGNPTGALFGFCNMLLKLIDDVKPTHIAAAFDMKAPTFRKLEYDAYKATRKPMPDDLVAQLAGLRKLLTAMNIKILEKEGYEADDIIGTIAHRFDLDTVIVSGDKDCLQLIDDNTVVYNTKKGVTDIVKYDAETLLAETGFAPSQIIDFKALAGDKSDNIPGCPRIGELSAKNLLAEFGSVENIYKNIQSLKGSTREKIENNEDIVRLSYRLATICTEAPIECTLSDIAFDGFGAETIEVMKELAFNKLLPRAAKRIKGGEKTEFSKENDYDSFTTELSPNVKTEKVDFEGMKSIVKSLKPSDSIAVYYGEHIHFSVDGETEYVVEIAHTLFDLLGSSDPSRELSLLLDSKAQKIFFDAKKMMSTLKKEFDLGVKDDFQDVRLMVYLVNPSVNNEHIKVIMTDNALDSELFACSIWQAEKNLKAVLEELKLIDLYNGVELPLERVLFDMENAGFRVDLSMIEELHDKYSEELSSIVKEIYKEAGEEFNLNSTKQLGDILYGKLGLKTKKKNSRGFSVTAEVLETLEHPIIPLILRYRRLQKLLSTYVDGMKALVGKDGKVHTVFKQCFTTTGRLSSTEPNLQNIPVRYEEGREIRKIFIADEGHLLVGADYSQIELRLLAHFSEDEVLLNAYRNGADIHKETAAKIFGIPESEVTSKQRALAKTVNFGIIYGQSEFGLAGSLGTTRREATEFHKKYLETFPSIEKFMKANVDKAHKFGYMTSLKGRVRRFPEFESGNRNLIAFAERAAMNMPLQGSAADIIKIAMLGVHNALKNEGLESKLILQVHDELIIDAPIGEVETVKYILKREMENAVSLKVPLPVEVGVGERWFDAK